MLLCSASVWPVHLQSAPGPGGRTNEMLKVCLDDAEVSQLLFLAAQDMAKAHIPESAKTFMLATMTALQKKDGGGRVHVALSTRAGTDCVGHAVRVMIDAETNATVLSIDGIVAYDHVLRSAMMSKLYTVP